MARKPGVPVNKKGEKINKTDFVLKFPGMPAKDIIAKAKVEGFDLTDRYIYSIRSAARVRRGKPAAAAVGVAPRGGAPTAGGKISAEQALYAVAAQIGLPRAIGLLQAQQKILLSVLGTDA